MPTASNVWGNRCGTSALCKMYAEKKNLASGTVDGLMVFDGVSRKEPEALQCLQDFTREIAVQLFNIQTILDPERFAIGSSKLQVSE